MSRNSCCNGWKFRVPATAAATATAAHNRLHQLLFFCKYPIEIHVLGIGTESQTTTTTTTTSSQWAAAAATAAAAGPDYNLHLAAGGSCTPACRHTWNFALQPAHGLIDFTATTSLFFFFFFVFLWVAGNKVGLSLAIFMMQYISIFIFIFLFSPHPDIIFYSPCTSAITVQDLTNNFNYA